MVALENLIREYEQRVPSSMPWELRYQQTTPGARPTPFFAVTSGNATVRHFFEALWSPLAKHKVPVLRVTAWLISASLHPARFRARHSPDTKKNADAIPLIVLGAALAFLSLVGGFALGMSLATAGLAWAAPISLEQVGEVSCLVLLAWSAWANRTAFSRKSLASETLTKPIVAADIVLAGVAMCAVWAFISDVMKHGFGIVLLLLVGLAFVVRIGIFALSLRHRIADSIADVYIATRDDINDPAYRIRESITEQVADLLHSVLVAEHQTHEPRYRKILVLGHSLGSLIALDAIRRLHERYLADGAAPPPLDRLFAFVTYGSPLQKLGVLGGLDGLPRSTFERILREKTRSTFDPNQPGSAVWANYWFLEDPISDPLGCAEWLSPFVVDVELLRGRYFSSHGDYVKEQMFWRNERNTGLLDLLG